MTSGEPAEQTYEGPLDLTREEAQHPGSGAAGNVVDCDTWGSGGFSDVDVYAEGATASGPEQALMVAASESGFGGVQAPRDPTSRLRLSLGRFVVLASRQLLEALGGAGVHGRVDDHVQIRVVRGCQPVVLELQSTDDRMLERPLA